MARLLVMEEFHLTVYVPRGLPEAEYRAIRRALNSRRFRGRLGRALRAVARQYRSLGAEMLAAAPRTAARAGQVAVPLLMLHGADDPLCLAEGSRSFHAGVDTAGSALRVYPELRHEIFNEPEREAVWQDVQTWLEERSA